MEDAVRRALALLRRAAASTAAAPALFPRSTLALSHAKRRHEEREGDDRWSQPGSERERPDKRGRGGFTVQKPRSNGHEGQF